MLGCFAVGVLFAAAAIAGAAGGPPAVTTGAGGADLTPYQGGYLRNYRLWVVKAPVGSPAIASSQHSGSEVTVAGRKTAGGKRDFGDAPDGRTAGYEGTKKLAAVRGRFPSLDSSGGASHENVGKLRLGANVTSEGDSQQVDRDPHDDGFSARVRRCERVDYAFVVDASGISAKSLRKGRVYLNVWADWTQDGDWRDAVRCGASRSSRSGDKNAVAGSGTVPEWVIENHRLNLKSFANEPVQDVVIKKLAGATGSQMWMRATISETPFQTRIRDGRRRIRNDGRGSFNLGETEDYFSYAEGPVEEGAEGPEKGKESARCEPPRASYLHNATAQLEFVITDRAGESVDVRKTEYLKGPLPKGWKVEVDKGGITGGGVLVPPAPVATVTFRVHEMRENGGFERRTLWFKVTSASGKSFIVGCGIDVFHPPHKHGDGGKDDGEVPPFKGDYGDAPDRVLTASTPLFPLCNKSYRGFPLCEYPSKAAHGGPVHEYPFVMFLGDRVSAENDSNQVNADASEDGFAPITPLRACSEVTFAWRIVVDTKRKPASRLESGNRFGLLNSLEKTGKGARPPIFLNLWFDADNDGRWGWESSVCGGPTTFFDLDDHRVTDSRLSPEEIKRLKESFDAATGRYSVVVVRTVAVGNIPAEGPGCWRGQVSNTTYESNSRGSGRRGAINPRLPYSLGETEDYCPPPRDPPTTDTPGQPGPTDENPDQDLPTDGNACSQRGQPDTTFGTGGILHHDLSSGGVDLLNAIVRRDGGQIVAAGSANTGQTAIAQFTADGTPDLSFGAGGKVVGNASGAYQGVALQADGKAVAAGVTSHDIIVARYNTDGSLDTTFDGDGMTTIAVAPGSGSDTARDVEVRSDGRILLGGDTFTGAISGTDGLLVQLNPDGSPDTSFGGGDGIITVPIAPGNGGDGLTAVTILPDGTIIGGGYSGETPLIIKTDASGTLAGSFGTGGAATPSVGGFNEIANDVLVHSDGRIVFVGQTAVDGGGTDTSAAIGVLNADGSPHMPFSGDGVHAQNLGSEDDAFETVILGQGKILASGIAHKQGTKLLFLFSGALDTGFGDNGTATVPKGSSETAQRITAAVALPDGRIFVAGDSVPESGVLADWFLEIECP